MEMNVREIRKGAKLTQKEFAVLVGCDVRTVRAWENGQQPNGDYRERITALANSLAPVNANEPENKLLRTFYTARALIDAGSIMVSDIIDIIYEYCDFEMCEKYLKKWADHGFYRIRGSASCGTFLWDKLPPRYMKVIKNQEKNI